VLVGLPGFHVIKVLRADDRLIIDIESETRIVGCPKCGVIAQNRGRRVHDLVDAPCFGASVKLRWHKRTWRCVESECPSGVFTEQDEQICRPRALLSARACWWAIKQLRKENVSVRGLARQLGTTWRTAWNSIRPILEQLDADQTRFEDVSTLGVDEHIWHHCNPIRRGPKEITGIVNLSRDGKGKTRAKLLDLVPGRSGTVYKQWLDLHGDKFKIGVKIAALDPFRGYKTAIDDRLQDATSVLDAFHVVKLAGTAVDEVRCRVQQETLGHRGRKNDPLYGIRTILRSGAEKLSKRQWERFSKAIEANLAHEEVFLAWQLAQQIRDAYHQKNLNDGLQAAMNVIEILNDKCPIPEFVRLGKTLKQWKKEYLAYFTTNRTNNGGTEAINGLIELQRRVARGFTNYQNYRLRMLLIGGAFNHPKLN
jgi:transposase